MSNKWFYAVLVGRKPGIYREWYGPNGAEAQVREFPDALHRKFRYEEDAIAWMKEGQRMLEQHKLPITLTLNVCTPSHLPNPMQECLVRVHNNASDTAYYHIMVFELGRWIDLDGEGLPQYHEVTHWSYLPEVS